VSFWSYRHLLEAGGNAESLLAKVARITTWSTACQFVWRGHPDQAWTLHSALFERVRRQLGADPSEVQLREAETRLLAQALRRGVGGTPGDPELQRLAVLQHHGTATRFIDVTTDPMIALWFACEDHDLDDRPGILFAIEVSKAKSVEWSDTRPVAEVVDSLGPDQLAVYWPRAIDARIQVQRGAFVFGHVPNDLATRAATSVPIRLPFWTVVQRQSVFGQRGPGRPPVPSILALSIPTHTKRRLLAILERSYGYSAETIYPDIDGFSRAYGRRSP
jgi:hypothetical protein